MKAVIHGAMILCLLILHAGNTLADENQANETGQPAGIADWEWDNVARDERGINLLSARTPEKGTWLFSVTHRAWESVDDKPVEDLLGLDSGSLKIGLGLRYALLNRMDLGFQRINGTAEQFDTYEFDGRLGLLNQHQHGLDVAIRGGISWFVQPEADDASGFFGQFLANRSIGKRILLGAGLLYHSDSSSDLKTQTDDDMSWGAGASIEISILPNLAWNIEGVWNAGGYGLDNPITATSLKLKTYRHTFSLVLSNSQYTGADGIAANAWREPDDLVIGFNITRQL